MSKYPALEAAFNNVGDNVEFARKETLDFGHQPALILIRQGFVKVIQTGPSGKRLAIDLLGTGKIFGEWTMSQNSSVSFTAESLTPGRARALRLKDLTAQYGKTAYPKLERELALLTADWLGHLTAKLEQMAFRSIHSAVAGFLLQLAENHGKSTIGGILLNLPLSHEQIAEFVGSARSNVTTNLDDLIKSGVIQMGHHRILIADPTALKKIAATANVLRKEEYARYR